MECPLLPLSCLLITLPSSFVFPSYRPFHSSILSSIHPSLCCPPGVTTGLSVWWSRGSTSSQTPVLEHTSTWRSSMSVSLTVSMHIFKHTCTHTHTHTHTHKHDYTHICACVCKKNTQRFNLFLSSYIVGLRCFFLLFL